MTGIFQNIVLKFPSTIEMKWIRIQAKRKISIENHVCLISIQHCLIVSCHSVYRHFIFYPLTLRTLKSNRATPHFEFVQNTFNFLMSLEWLALQLVTPWHIH